MAMVNIKEHYYYRVGPPSYKWVYKPLQALLTIAISTIKPLIRQLSYLGGPILYSWYLTLHIFTPYNFLKGIQGLEQCKIKS